VNVIPDHSKVEENMNTDGTLINAFSVTREDFGEHVDSIAITT
jgi:hypothetical protein